MFAQTGRLNYDAAMALRRPFVAYLRIPDVGGHAIYVERLTPTDALVVDPRIGEPQALPRSEFESLWDGRAVWLFDR